MSSSMPSAPPDGRYRLLLLEADEMTAQKLLGFLEKTGFECRHATDSENGMVVFQALDPHIVIMPALTPHVDGHAFCRWIRGEKDSTIPVLMRGAADEGAEVTAFKVGADDYLPAPLRPAILMARVVAHLRRSYRYNAPAAPAANPFGLPVEEDVPVNALPRGWAECELCGFRAPRPGFEKEDIMGQIRLTCPSCRQSDHVIISID